MNQPNILLITTDQQRYDTWGALAPPFLRTPHLNQLARQGISFDRAYADCPMCVPTRMAIMTGRQVFGHGMYNNGPSSEVLERDTTLPSVLRSAGYQTAAIGKMHFAPQRARHGFDEMVLPDDYYLEMERSGVAQQPMRHGLGQNEYYPAMATVPEARTLTAWTAEQCVHYLRERRDPTLPFFLWCSYSKPHPPFDPPEPYYSMYRNEEIPPPVKGDWADDPPPAFRTAGQTESYDRIPPGVLRETRAAYYGLITHIDYTLGRVLAALSEAGVSKDTLVLFASDHGDFLGDHDTCQKGFFHDPAARVPMILRLPPSWPERYGGTTCTDLVTHADILPTCQALAGAQAPPSVQGQDLLGLVRGEAEGRQELCGTCGVKGVGLWYGITDGRWKYIYYMEGDREQLFDLQNDPQECRDVGRDPETLSVRRDLRRRLESNIQRLGAATPEADLKPRPVSGETEAERRARPFPGFFTEYAKVDVRH